MVVSGHYVARTEVTNGQFHDYLQKAVRDAPEDWERAFLELKRVFGEDARNFPAVNLTRQQGQDYARFALGQLPTEAQWEFDARSGGEQRHYVWGDARPGRERARIDFQDGGKAAAVGTFPEDRTRQGAFDFNGNVQEWCRDAWTAYRREAPDPDRPLRRRGRQGHRRVRRPRRRVQRHRRRLRPDPPPEPARPVPRREPRLPDRDRVPPTSASRVPDRPSGGIATRPAAAGVGSRRRAHRPRGGRSP